MSHLINEKKIWSDSMLFFALERFFFLRNVSIFSNFHEDNEGLINRQINLELYASYVYMAMSHHFGRPDVAFKGKNK